jgi:predicted DsbA family dithiol-disulfide isomerase
MDAQLATAGKSVGIEFRYDLQTHTPNTFDSHRLVWLAGTSGVQDAVIERPPAIKMKKGL